MSSSMPLEANKLQNEPFVPNSFCPRWIVDISTSETLELWMPTIVICSLDNMDIPTPHDSILGHITRLFVLCFMVLGCIIRVSFIIIIIIIFGKGQFLYYVSNVFFFTMLIN